MTTSQWSRSNRSTMGSNAITDQNQGGGEKKAGFPYQVGREHFTSIFITPTSLKVVNNTKLPLANFSRNIGRNNNAPYWKLIH
jgi:hypothetical protein